MAKKPKISKTQAVRDYVTTHPDAMSGEIAAALNKKGIKITVGHVANIKTKLNKEAHVTKKTAKKPAKKATRKRAPVEAAAPAVAETPVKNGGITLEQIKNVAHTIKTLGGLPRLTEVLEVIKELGGVKKFRDLAEAMSVSVVDDIPF